MPKTRRSSCPISLALEIFGDRWSLLIVRDLMLKGRNTFRDLAEGGENIASNVLTDRLRHLEQHGIIESRPDRHDARRRRYRLTRKGLDLAPMLAEVISWSARYGRTAASESELTAIRSDRDGWVAAIEMRLASDD